MREFPEWIRCRWPSGAEFSKTKEILARYRLNTVCQSAHCPNVGECFSRLTATFMILGDRCTRGCRFCAIGGGRTEPPEPDEPERVAEAARELGLGYVVVTSVTRDDLDDGGSAHFAATVRSLHAAGVKVEVLVPDFGGNGDAIVTVVESGPEVFDHNVETVPRLYRDVRPGADYARSVKVLAHAKNVAPDLLTKSGIMVGLGEKKDEIHSVMQDLRETGCDIFTIGQYLSPSSGHCPVQRFVRPEEFEEYSEVAKTLGFLYAVSAPLARSSYKAAEAFEAVSRGLVFERMEVAKDGL